MALYIIKYKEVRELMRSSLRIITIFCLVFLFVMPVWVGAEEENQPAEKEKKKPVIEEKTKTSDVFTLGEIEVRDSSETSKNITVEKISSEEIREFNRDNVAKAVNLLPGVTISQGGARNESTVYVRGFDSRRVPIFLDGIPIYVPYDGYPDIGRFTTFDVSEIIVSKGFTSVLYGPNTEGGAINMVSRKPQKIFEGEMGAGYGTGGTYNGYLNLGTNQKWWYLQGGVSYLSSNYSVLSDNFNTTKALVYKTEDGGQRENSYYHDGKWNLKLGLTPAEGHEYALSFIKQHGAKGNPPYAGYFYDFINKASPMIRYWKWPYWDKESLYLTTKTPIGKETYVKTRFYYDKYQNSLWSYDDDRYLDFPQKKKSSFRSDYDDHTQGFSIEAGTELLPRNNIKAAFHYKVDYHHEHNLPNPYQHFKDDIMSFGIEDTITITNKFYSILGISYDSIKTIEAEDTYSWKTGQPGYFAKNNAHSVNPQIGFFYNLTNTAKIYATVADKSRLPTMKDKYSYRMGTALPNPDLKAEKSTNYEIGYQDTFWKKIGFKTALFYSNVRDMILLVRVRDSKTGNMVNQNQNITKVKRYGAEMEITAALMEKLESGFNYTYIFHDNDTITWNTTNNRFYPPDMITDIPRHKLFAYVKYMPLKGLSLLADIEYNSDRYSSSDGMQTAGSFSVTNFSATYEFVKNAKIEAGIANIFDRDYELSDGYPMPGRSYFVNMRYSF